MKKIVRNFSNFGGGGFKKEENHYGERGELEKSQRVGNVLTEKVSRNLGLRIKRGVGPRERDTYQRKVGTMRAAPLKGGGKKEGTLKNQQQEEEEKVRKRVAVPTGRCGGTGKWGLCSKIGFG